MHTELLLDVEHDGLRPAIFSFFCCLQKDSAMKCCVKDEESFNHFRQVVKFTGRLVIWNIRPVQHTMVDIMVSSLAFDMFVCTYNWMV